MMFCHQCGAQIAEGADFCHKCGTKVVYDNNFYFFLLGMGIADAEYRSALLPSVINSDHSVGSRNHIAISDEKNTW